MAIALTKGQSAARLLRDADFNAVYQELLENNIHAIVTSKPGQVELREDAYYRIRGVQEMALKMNEWRVVAEQLEASMRRDSSPEGQE